MNANAFILPKNLRIMSTNLMGPWVSLVRLVALGAIVPSSNLGGPIYVFNCIPTKVIGTDRILEETSEASFLAKSGPHILHPNV